MKVTQNDHKEMENYHQDTQNNYKQWVSKLLDVTYLSSAWFLLIHPFSKLIP